MKRLHIVVLAAGLGLLAVGIACNGGDDAPVPSDTPARTADAATATLAVEPTVPPCPVDDDSFCEFAEEIDRALQDGDVQTIVASTELASQTCTASDHEGPCSELPEGTELSGYIISFDNSDNFLYETEEAYRSLLGEIASVNASASDQYGDGSWRLAAIVDGPDMKVLVTTSIGPDPIANDADQERRVFLFWARRPDDAWLISVLLTTAFDETHLTGTFQDGGLRPGWLPWGEE